MSDQKVFTLKIGGYAGQGVKSAGLVFAKVATRSGYQTSDHTEYPSLIKGGHNVMQVSVSYDQVTGPRKTTDFLIAFNQQTVDLYGSEMKKGSGVMFDKDDRLNLSKVSQDVNLFGVPLSQIAADSGGKDLLSNTVALGALVGLIGGDLNILKQLISEEFADKSADIVSTNHKAAEGGYRYAIENCPDKIQTILKPLEKVTPRMIINGNGAVALGAIAAGLQYAAIYPMSPISNILHVLAAYQEKYGYVYKQPEDEISAINMAIGASYAGARSMTATSGGGFCLMTEGYGLAGMTETPLVIIEGMRGGPATGLPTWSEQGDLRFVLHAHQGDFPRIVLAAGDASDAFYLTMEAFYLADKYQTPVVLLIDKNICEVDQSFPYFDISAYRIDRGKYSTQKMENYKRFQMSEDGISLRTIPGTGNFFIANSDEHDEQGFSTEEIDERVRQVDKRMKKLDTCKTQDMPDQQLYGPEDADVTIVSWGSNKGSILQAMKNFTNVNYLHITWMSPFPTEKVKSVLEKSKHILNIESNFTGQLAGLIKENTGIDIADIYLKYDGRPFYPEDIVEWIEKILKK